jgi:hypothetical protein
MISGFTHCPVSAHAALKRYQHFLDISQQIHFYYKWATIWRITEKCNLHLWEVRNFSLVFYVLLVSILLHQISSVFSLR